MIAYWRGGDAGVDWDMNSFRGQRLPEIEKEAFCLPLPYFL